MKITFFDSQQKLDDYAASLIAETISSRKKPVLGLATGSTPIGIYKNLVQKHQRGELSFREVTTYNLDEYAGLTAAHHQSYAYFMNHHLFQHVDLPPQNRHIPNGTAADLLEECQEYDRMIAAQPIDLQLLGIGHNGHIGFNEPASGLTGATHVVDLQEETLQANARFFTSIDEVPKRAITMGVGAILKAKTILLVVRGADKAAIVKQALTGPITTHCPASLLQTHANVVVLLDQEAGRELLADEPSLLNMAHS
ncbi:glucosamine-6-phosphate deaminase [Paenibacillaceae bacterium]|nr:glucosamine-6-phosphate deaminase [Paenibacillaceae bacterium]